jgi:hypothetical protein
LALSRRGIDVGLAVPSTTIVFGLALATASMTASCPHGNDDLRLRHYSFSASTGDDRRGTGCGARPGSRHPRPGPQPRARPPGSPDRNRYRSAPRTEPIGRYRPRCLGAELTGVASTSAARHSTSFAERPTVPHSPHVRSAIRTSIAAR